MQDPCNRVYPRKIVIAPSSDLHQKVTVVVKSFEEVLNAQRNRYEIIDWCERDTTGAVEACEICGRKSNDVQKAWVWLTTYGVRAHVERMMCGVCRRLESRGEL